MNDEEKLSSEAEKVFDEIIKEFREDQNLHISAKLPIALREYRKTAAEELIKIGYIRNVNCYGKQDIACTLTEKALQKIKNIEL